MSIWTLTSFALCMLTAVLSLQNKPAVAHLGFIAFLGTLAMFVVCLWIGGIRKPVV